MLNNGERRLLLNIDDLREFKPDLAKQLVDYIFFPSHNIRFLSHPTDFIPPFQAAIKEYATNLGFEEAKNPETEFFVGIEGSFGSHHVSPRQLCSWLIGTLVLVEGIITKGLIIFDSKCKI
jgi:DNA replication licensing factor MCM3